MALTRDITVNDIGKLVELQSGEIAEIIDFNARRFSSYAVTIQIIDPNTRRIQYMTKEGYYLGEYHPTYLDIIAFVETSKRYFL